MSLTVHSSSCGAFLLLPASAEATSNIVAKTFFLQGASKTIAIQSFVTNMPRGKVCVFTCPLLQTVGLMFCSLLFSRLADSEVSRVCVCHAQVRGLLCEGIALLYRACKIMCYAHILLSIRLSSKYLSCFWSSHVTNCFCSSVGGGMGGVCVCVDQVWNAVTFLFLLFFYCLVSGPKDCLSLPMSLFC